MAESFSFVLEAMDRLLLVPPQIDEAICEKNIVVVYIYIYYILFNYIGWTCIISKNIIWNC